MAEEIDYKRLRDLVREEKGKPGLVALPQDFHTSLAAFLSSKRGTGATDPIMHRREFENAAAVIRELSSIRQQKILFRAVRSPGRHEKTEEMTREEHELYDRFCAIIEDANGSLEGMLSKYSEGTKIADEKPLAPLRAEGETAQQNGVKRVRFIKEIPAYKGANNETFGPYKSGEAVFLPQGEADWLLRGKMAEEAIA